MRFTRYSPLLFLFLFSFVIAMLPTVADADCRNRLEQANRVRNDIARDLSSSGNRQAYVNELRAVLESLEPCLKAADDPDLELQIRTAVGSIRGKISQLTKKKDYTLPGDCRKCADQACRNVCERWKRANEYYRKKYRSKIEPFDTLECGECLRYLEDFHTAVGELAPADMADENETFSRETVQVLWGILYRVARDKECLEKGGTMIRKIMFPKSMTAKQMLESIPDKVRDMEMDERARLVSGTKALTEEKKTVLTALFMDILKDMDPEKIQAFCAPPADCVKFMAEITEMKEKITMLEAEKMPETSKSELLSFYTDLFSNADSGTIQQWQTLMASVSEIESEQQRKMIVEMIPDIKWDKIIDLLDEMETIETREGIIAIYNFMLTDVKPGDRDNVRPMNQAFRTAAANKYKLPVEERKRRVFDKNFYVLNVGEKFKKTDPDLKNKDVFLKITGNVNRTGDQYVVMVRFLSENNFVLFSENLGIPVSAPDENTLQMKFEAMIDRFETFRKTLGLASKKTSASKAADFEKIEAYISKGVYEDNRIYEQLDKKDLDRIPGVYIRGAEFWGDNVEADGIFGRDIKNLVTDRIHKWYFKKRPHTLLLERPVPNCLIVKGGYQTDEASNYSRITVSYFTDRTTDLPYSENTLYFPTVSRDETDKIFAIKMRLVSMISKSLANYLDLIPETEKAVMAKASVTEARIKSEDEIPADKPKRIPELSNFRAFMMPGHLRTEYEKDPGTLVKMWNWSNFTILGLSLASEFMFIHSEYEDEGYYWAGLAGIGLFCANGAMGVIDAHTYDPPRQVRSWHGPFLSYNEKHDKAMLLIGYSF